MLLASELYIAFDQQGLVWNVFRCKVWCEADLSDISTSSEQGNIPDQPLLIKTNITILVVFSISNVMFDVSSDHSK